MKKRLKIYKLRQRLLSAFIVFAIFGGMFYHQYFNVQAANGVKQNGYMHFYIVDRQSGAQSSVTVKVWSNSGSVDASHFWGQSTHWKCQVTSAGVHGIDTTVRDIWTQPDGNGKYRVFHIPIYFYQSAHYYCDTIDVAKNGANADALYASGLDTSLVHGTTYRGFTLVVNGSQLGVCTRSGTFYPKGGAGMALYYTRPTYTVSFNGNGGTSNQGALTISCGQSLYESQGPAFAFWLIAGGGASRVGYNCIGWSTTSTGSANVTGDTTICANTTFYAVWEKKKATYTYNANGGSGDMGSTVINYGESGTLSKNTFTRSGYVFKGWSTSENGDLVYVDEDTVSHNKDSSPTINLYAVWERKQDAYKFHANGGTGTMSDYIVGAGESGTLPANTLKKTGYTFKGWSTSEADTTISYANQASVSKASDDATDKTYDLYAVWEPNTCTVVYHKNGGKGTQIANSSVKYNSPSLTLPACTYTKPGYTFQGWSTTARGKVQYNNKQTISVASWIGTGSKPVTLYAVWKKNDANFNTDKVQKDKGMFQNDTKLKGQNGTSYDSSKTDSKYAIRDTEGQKGYFSEK